MVSIFSRKVPFIKNTTVYRAKIRPMWSNFTAIYQCIFQKRQFFETLELFKITKVCGRNDPKIEQNMLKNSVFLKKNRPGWSNFFVKYVIFLLISRIFAFFRVPGSCNFGNFDGFAAKWSFVKITVVNTPSLLVKLTFKFCYYMPAFRTNIRGKAVFISKMRLKND